MAKEEMTKEKAVAILQSGNSLHFDEAREFLQKNYPEIWKEYEKTVNEAAAAKAASQESVLKSIEMVAQNKEELRVLANHYDMGQIGIKEFVNPIMDRVDMYQKDEKTGKDVLLSKEEKTDYFKVLYSSARLEVEQALVQSESFHNATPKEKKERVREAIEDNMLVKIYRVAAASAAELPSDKEANPDSPNFFKYNKRQADKFRKMAKDVLASDKRIKINTDAVLLSVADTAARTESFSEKLHETAKSFDGVARQKLNDVADHFKKRKSSLELWANKVSKGKYQETVKPVVKALVKGGKDSIKDNIFKIGTNFAIGVGAAVAMKVGVAAAPLVFAYGVYHGVTSWGWPIVTETRKAHRLAKEAGQPISWKEARKQGVKTATATKKVVKTDKNGKEVVKKKNPYVVRGVINSVLGIAGGIALSKAFAAKDAVENAANIVTTAADSTKNVVRSQALGFRMFKALTPSGAQMLDAGVSFMTDPHDPTTRKRAGWEALGALTTAAVSGTLLGVSEYNATHEGGLRGLWDHLLHRDTPASGNGGDVLWDPEGRLPQVGENGGVDATDVQPNVEPETFFIPQEWDKSMGISKGQYLAQLREQNNVDEYFQHYHARLHNEDIMPWNAYAHAMMKAHDLVDYLPEGTTEEQVVTQYFALFGHYHFANKDLIAIDKPLPLGSFSNHDPEMTALYKYLFCDGKLEDLDQSALDHLMNAKEYMLGHSDADNHNVIVKFVQHCKTAGNGSRWAGTPAPKVPEFEEEIEVAEDPIYIPPTKALDTTVPAVRKMAVVAKVEDPTGREYLAKSVSDHWNNAKIQKTISDEEAERLIRIQEKLAGKSK